MILWEDAPCTVSHLCERALLNTNTLTPLLKRMEQSGYLTRTRSAEDERVVLVALTTEGAALKAACTCVPLTLAASLGYPEASLTTLKELLDDLVGHLRAADLKGD